MGHRQIVGYVLGRRAYFDMLSIRSILVMPSQCSICRSFINRGYSNRCFADTHLASVLEIAYPASVSGVQLRRPLKIADLDTSNVLCSLEILTSTLRKVSLLPDQHRESTHYGLFPVCLDICEVNDRSVKRARCFSFREPYEHYTRGTSLLLQVLCPPCENR